MSKIKKQKQYKGYFIQDWGTYLNQTFICVRMNHDEIVRAMKKMKVSKNIIKKFENDKQICDEKWFTNDNNATGWMQDGRTLLRFKDWKNDWEHWDTLVHEISHLIDYVFDIKNMSLETEAKAYQFEYLFREIRRTLWKIKKS